MEEKKNQGSNPEEESSRHEEQPQDETTKTAGSTSNEDSSPEEPENPLEEKQSTEPPIDITETDDDAGLLEAYKEYLELLRYLDKNDYFEDRSQIEEFREEFNYWKKFIFRLARDFDDLYYDFTELFESPEYLTLQTDRILAFPVDRNRVDKSLERIKVVTDDLNAFVREQSGEETDMERRTFMQAIKEIPHTFLFSSYEFAGKFHVDEDRLETKEDKRLLKEQMETVLLIWRKFYKCGSFLLELMTWLARAEEEWVDKSTNLEFERLHKSSTRFRKAMLISENRDKKRKEIEDKLKDNFRFKNELEALAQSCRKKYFEFLNRRFLSVVNDLSTSAGKIEERYSETVHSIKEKKIFIDLNNLLLSYLKEKLFIFPIPCKVGEDSYDPVIHNPYVEAEPDETLENDKIKEIINDGFYFQDPDTQRKEIIKLVDVIVVKNQS